MGIGAEVGGTSPQCLAKEVNLAVRAAGATKGLEERENSRGHLHVLTPLRDLRELFCFLENVL